MSRFDNTFIHENDRDTFSMKVLMVGRERLKASIARYGMAPVEILEFIRDIDFAEDCMHYLNDCWDATCALFPTESEPESE